MEYKDYYKILGVDRNASEADIKKAYRRLARKYHPDVSKEANAERRFKEINEANAVLADKEKRQAYDQLGANWRNGQDFRAPPGWQGGFNSYTNGGGARSGFSGSARGDFGGGGFSDFFESLFGGGFAQAAGRQGAGPQAQRAPDQQATLPVSLEEAYAGVSKGMRVGERHLQVKVPAGVTQGQRIRVPGQGGAGHLYLEINIRPHRLFRLDGKDVLLDVPITPWEAALGAEIKVPTLGGRVGIKVPAGSTSGRKLRLKGRGLPGNPPGDQYCVLQIVAPEAKSEAQRAFYRDMEAAFNMNPRAHF